MDGAGKWSEDGMVVGTAVYTVALPSTYTETDPEEIGRFLGWLLKVEAGADLTFAWVQETGARVVAATVSTKFPIRGRKK